MSPHNNKNDKVDNVKPLVRRKSWLDDMSIIYHQCIAMLAMNNALSPDININISFLFLKIKVDDSTTSLISLDR